MSKVRQVWWTIAIVFTLVVAGLSTVLLAQRLIQYKPHIAFTHTHTTTRTTSATASPTAQPAYLLIPKIGVHAAIEQVGTAADGTMATASQSPWENVGWYKFGPSPGEQGSAVIGGHLDRPGGSPAVFWDLHNLITDDTVTVMDTQGKSLHFRVTHTALYSAHNAPLQQIFGDMSGIHLNVYTCAGTWIPTLHETTQRFVAYTTMIS